MNKSLIVFCDGGSRGNPGPAAVGFLIKSSNGKTIARESKLIGKATNNVAEYTAVIEALKWLSRGKEKGWGWVMSNGSGGEDEDEEKRKPTLMTSPRPTTHNPSSPRITFYLDSKLVVNQLNGLFKIKNSHLRNLIVEVRTLERNFGSKITYRFIPREKNKEADDLVNQIFKQI